MKTIHQQLKEAITPQVNESADINSLAREVAKIIGSQLDPAEFYEYLEDYSNDEPNGEYGFDKDQLDALVDAFSEIDQQGLGNNIQLDASEVRESPLYKAYLKY